MVAREHADQTFLRASNWSGALSAEADAADMLEPSKKVGYDASVLKGKAATRKGVIGGIRDAAKQLTADGIFVLTYSGHGGQSHGDDDDDEDDLQDETWCQFDGELIDDELNQLWASSGPQPSVRPVGQLPQRYGHAHAADGDR